VVRQSTKYSGGIKGRLRICPTDEGMARTCGGTEMNVKQLLIERERAAYLSNDTTLAELLASTLDYVIGLEEEINSRDAQAEEAFDAQEIADACISAEIPDSKYESILIALNENRRR
jgi:hypothetical protein